ALVFEAGGAARRFLPLTWISSGPGSCCTSHSAIPELAKSVGASTQRRDTPRPSLFVGRERELADLRAGLEDALAGHGRLFLISGEPGIGKTRLAEQLSSQASEQGGRVLWGRCWEGECAPAYWPIVQILRGCTECHDFA